MWDNRGYKNSGRYFESNIGKRETLENSKTTLRVKTHTGKKGSFSKDKIFQIGCIPAVGDEVIAYWDGRPHAFLGKGLSL